MKPIWTVLVGTCVFATSCGTIDCYRPAEHMRLRVTGVPTAACDLTMARGNPVRVERMPNGDFRLSIPPERYGGMLIVCMPCVNDPERDWKVSVLRGEDVVLVTTIAEIRELRGIDGIRILSVEEN